ncbi:MAG: MFS transporter [Gemmatimonadetes bacterium]|nr:MFS transporter [Gemmatimonadota bacterium]
MTRFTPYQRRLFVLLSAANFFEGYDFFALGQVLPSLRSDFALSEAGAGRLVGLIGLGTILSYWVVRLADRLGRRRVLMITVLGYAVFTGLTGFSQNVWDFGVYQLLARIFLIAEWALAMVYAAEEFPAARRGFAIGMLQAWSALGSILCAVVVPFLLKTAYGWRSVYFVGIVPLLLLAYARRGLRETARFEAMAAGGAGRRLFAIWHTPYRRRVIQMALIWGFTYICTQNAVFFWKEFAVSERGLTDGQVGLAIAIASLVSLPMVFMVGRVFDHWGRRPSAVLICGLLAGSVVAAYQATGYWVLVAALTFAVFANASVLSLLNSFTTELFPTEWRGDAFGWANNLLGRIGYVIGPIVVGAAAGSIGWGNAVSLTAIAVGVTLLFIMVWLPETKGKELEETARVESVG